jgi:hypothetical protein
MPERNERPIFEGQNRRVDERREAERRAEYRREAERLREEKSKKFRLIFELLKYIAVIVFVTIVVKIFSQ